MGGLQASKTHISKVIYVFNSQNIIEWLSEIVPLELFN
jgi:hypothetical protein